MLIALFQGSRHSYPLQRPTLSALTCLRQDGSAFSCASSSPTRIHPSPEGGRVRRWGWQTKEAESKAWSKESLVEEEQGRSRRRMENKHLFFPGPAAHEGLLRGFPLGYSLAWPRSCPGVLQQPESPRCLIPPCPGSTLVCRAPCMWHQGPRLFLRQIPKFAVGLSLALPQCKPNSSFLPSTLQEL